MSESRFQHLLQPLRDLSQNWNIDLAQELEEYLDQLDSLNIAFDPNDEGSTATFGPRVGAADSKVMNFAEAALLIQGTSVIYSRKVEYLYALVYQTLAHLSKQHEERRKGPSEGAQAGQDAGNEGEDDGGEEGDGGDTLGNALPVYDELEEARETLITLRKTDAGRGGDKRKDAGLSRSKNNLQASVALMGSLVPGERDHGDAFKLMSCNLHVSGVMLLDEGSRKFLEEETDFKYVRGEKTPRRPSLGHVEWDLAGDDGNNPTTTLNFDDAGDDDDDDNMPDFGGYDGDFGGGGDEPSDDADTFRAEAPSNDATVVDEPADTGSTRRVAFKRAAAAERDPWAPLDPYDASSATSRPFRKGRSYPRRPPYKTEAAKLSNKKGPGGDDDLVDGLDDPLFKERFFAASNRPQWASWVWTETSETALEKKFKKKFCKAPVLVKSCDDLWKLETKWKSLVRKSAVKEEQSAQAMLLQEEAEEEEEEQMQAMNLHGSSAPLDLQFGELGADTAGGGDDGGAEEADDYDDDGGFDGGDWNTGDDYDSNDKYTDAVNAMAQLGGDRPLTYEEICRQHIESFMEGAEQYVRETDLTKQVNEWQSKLTPLLKQQDERPPFDIQLYGREIIGNLEEKRRVSLATPKLPKRQRTDEEDKECEVVPFDKLAGGKNSYEVCRMFLASLQLANNGNVQLVHGKTAADQARVPFQMQLLSTANVYESLHA